MHHRIKIYFLNCNIIVFKPSLVAGSVQGPGSGFWPGRPDQFLILKKIQNGVVLVKKQKTKVNGLQPCFWPWSTESPGHDFFYFFYQPDPVPAPSRSGLGSTHLTEPGVKTRCNIQMSQIFPQLDGQAHIHPSVSSFSTSYPLL
jgi:hypothetical protein